MNRTTVVGVFDDMASAERAVRDLKAAGFRDDQIGVAMRDAANRGTMATAEPAGSNAGQGAVTGGVLGGLLGAAAALLIPGIGPVIGLGLFGGTVLAAAAGGATLGALAGALIGWGVPEEEARYYQGEFEHGRTIVTVNAGSRYDEARNILLGAGGHDVESRGTRAATTQATTAPRAAAATTGNADTVRLREEQLRVEKERVQAGEVRIGKEVVSEQKTVEVPVTKEQVVIERRAVNQPSNAPITGDSRTIEVPITEERVNVSKETVVTEEIGVKKQVQQDTQTVSGTVRREEARIETEGNVPMAGTGSMGSSRTWESEMPTFQRNSGARWQQEEPYYRYGFDQYNSGRWSGKSWTDVEPEFRRDWTSRNPGGDWDVASNPIKHAWDHLTATPHTHTR